MKKKYVELSALEVLENLRNMPKPKMIKDEDIDYSDIPMLTAAELKKFKKVSRPLVYGFGTPISLSPDFDVPEKQKKKAKK